MHLTFLVMILSEHRQEMLLLPFNMIYWGNFMHWHGKMLQLLIMMLSMMKYGQNGKLLRWI